mgnify:CR=1 FL=1
MARLRKLRGQDPQRELPRVRLIPTVDLSDDDTRRKEDIDSLLTIIVANLHKRGRPKKIMEEELPHAA